MLHNIISFLVDNSSFRENEQSHDQALYHINFYMISTFFTPGLPLYYFFRCIIYYALGYLLSLPLSVVLITLTRICFAIHRNFILLVTTLKLFVFIKGGLDIVIDKFSVYQFWVVSISSSTNSQSTNSGWSRYRHRQILNLPILLLHLQD